MSSETQINLKTLQRVDSGIVDIIDNASQVAIYKYNRNLQKWEGTDVEGALFLYRRSLPPYHGFIIVNRTNTTNFIESITSDMQCQLQEPYFLYKNNTGDIVGSWFYERKDLLRISKKIQGMVQEQEESGRPRSGSDFSTASKDESRSILSLLSQAHDEYMLQKNVIKEDSPPSVVKSVNPPPDKAHGRSPALRSASQNDCSTSPRPKFLSTGSYDAERSKYAHDFFSGESFLKVQKLKFVETNKSPGSCIPNFSAPTRLSPLFSQDEIASPLTHEVDSSEADWRTSAGTDTKLHLSTIRQTLHSHINNNPKVLLQIHEAYVSSLRSLFSKNC